MPCARPSKSSTERPARSAGFLFRTNDRSLKWLCAPKGAGFLWARPEQQAWIEPLVISWGYGDDVSFGELYAWEGTRDPTAYLAVPKAIAVHATFDLVCSRALADEAERRLHAIGLPRVPGTPAPFMRIRAAAGGGG
jgi:isopenicillin-N epimerase